MSNPITAAVVTGGHPFDVPGLHNLFRALNGINAYIQHMDDFATAREPVRNAYDVVVFYSMLKDGPTGRPLRALEGLLSSGKGVVMLHHAILGYPDWKPWVDMVGVKAASFQSYSHDEPMRIAVADQNHPITHGISNWEMIDETYVMAEPDADSHVLLTTDHPACMKTIGWTRQVDKTRVFNFQSGHDNQTWVNSPFQQVLTRGIQWAAGRL